MMTTEHCTIKRSILFFILVILAKIEMLNGEMRLKAMPEKNSTSAELNFTTEIAMQSIRNDRSFILETDSITPTAEMSTGKNATIKPKPINGNDQFDTDTVTGVLNLLENCELAPEELITTQRSICKESRMNMTIIPVNNSSSGDDMLPKYIALTFSFVGMTVVILNLIVIVIAYSSKELRQNTYLNLILTLSVNDFLFGLSTLFTGIRMFSIKLDKQRELCIISSIIIPICLLMTLYQSFLISLHRYLIISESDWDKTLFEKKRSFIWYMTGWVVIIVSQVSLISPMSDFGSTCTVDNIFNENKSLIVLIVAISEFVLIFLILVFYCSTMVIFKKHHLNTSNSTISNTILKARRKKFLKSMKSVSILLLALFILSGPMVVRNFFEVFNPLPGNVSFIAFVLTNMNSLVNPLIYFFNLVEFKTALGRICCRSQTSENV